MSLLFEVVLMLSQAREQAKNFKGGIYDTEGLQSAILNKEFHTEINYFERCLSESGSDDDFKATFLARCAWRDVAVNECIGFKQVVETPTNRLYIALATVLFNTKNLADLLRIILPGVSRVMTFVTPTEFPIDTPKRERVYLMEESLPEVRFQGSLAALADLPPTVESLKQCVIESNFIFVLNLSSFSAYSYRRHVVLFNYLKSEYPQFAAKLYTHNPVLSELEYDIECHDLPQLTPLQALKALSRDLKISGMKQTGTEKQAGPIAAVAQAQFLAYWDRLEDQVREQILSLPFEFGTSTLNDLFADVKHEVTCVEQLSSRIDRFLARNQGSPLLCVSRQVNIGFLDHKYTEKLNDLSQQTLRCYPETIAKQLFSSIVIEDADAFRLFMNEIPPQLLGATLVSINMQAIDSCLPAFAEVISEGQLTSHQLNAILSKYGKYFALSSHGIAVIDAILMKCSKGEQDRLFENLLLGADSVLACALKRGTIGMLLPVLTKSIKLIEIRDLHLVLITITRKQLTSPTINIPSYDNVDFFRYLMREVCPPDARSSLLAELIFPKLHKRVDPSNLFSINTYRYKSSSFFLDSSNERSHYCWISDEAYSHIPVIKEIIKLLNDKDFHFYLFTMLRNRKPDVYREMMSRSLANDLVDRLSKVDVVECKGMLESITLDFLREIPVSAQLNFLHSEQYGITIVSHLFSKNSDFAASIATRSWRSIADPLDRYLYARYLIETSPKDDVEYIHHSKIHSFYYDHHGEERTELQHILDNQVTYEGIAKSMKRFIEIPTRNYLALKSTLSELYPLNETDQNVRAPSMKK